MSAADEYREHAAACLQAAKMALREDVRAVLVDMAQKWNEAAVRWDRNAALLTEAPEPTPLEQHARPKGDGSNPLA